MNLRRTALLVVILVATAASPISADEGDRSADRQAVLAKGLDLIRTRVQAQVGLADALREAGRLDEAIDAYRKATTIYDTELRRIEKLIGFAQAARRVVAVTPPPRGADTPARPQPGSAVGIKESPPQAFKGRGAERAYAGSRNAANAVEDGLRWLAAHQSANGGWEAANFMHWCDGKPVSDHTKRPDGAGQALYDPGVTGLALCAFLGAGYTNRGKHPYARTMGMGLRYLKNIQDPEGCFGHRATPQYAYNHAMATLAMVEAYGMTGSPLFKGSAQRGLDFIALSRNPYLAWRYGIKPGDNDTSVSGWMLMPLHSARLINRDAVKRGKAAPLVVDEAAFDGMRAWLDKVTDPRTGHVGYMTRGSGSARPQELLSRFPAEKSLAMTASGTLSRTLIGEDPRRSPIIQKSLALLRNLPPVWKGDGSIDMVYWYLGILCAFQAGGETWTVWNDALNKQILPHQRQDTDHCQYKGSWDPVGPWGSFGGRVYATALMTMCAEVFYRYDRVAGTK